MLEDTLGEGDFAQHVAHKGWQRPSLGNMAKIETKNKTNLQIGGECTIVRDLFTTDVESMVTQKFDVPSCPPLVPMPGLFELLHYMFLGYIRIQTTLQDSTKYLHSIYGLAMKAPSS